MNILTRLSILALACLVQKSLAFAHLKGIHRMKPTNSIADSASAQPFRRTKSALFLSDGNDREDSRVNKRIDGPSRPPQWLETSVQFAIFLTTNAFSAICIGISAGLVLNVFGYGYIYDKEQGGIVIDTLPKLREEVQFRRAVYQSMHEAAVKPSSEIGSSKLSAPAMFVADKKAF